MTDYRLYCFAQSGNAYKVALMLNVCGAEWTPVFVDFFQGGARRQEFLALNAMGEVPVLDHRGRLLTQSGVILDYLAGRLGKFGPANEDERLEMMRWLLFDNHKLTGNTAAYRFQHHFLKVGQTPVTEFLRGRMISAFKLLNRHLDDRHFVVADRPTIADFSLCGYLFWPNELKVSWADFPAIGVWLDRIKALPGWAHPYEIMPGHPLPDA